MKLSTLVSYLEQFEFYPNAYSIGIGIPEADETYCLVQENGIWRIYYAERGQRSDMREYANEEEACNAFVELLKSDTSIWLK